MGKHGRTRKEQKVDQARTYSIMERRTDVKLGWDQPELPWHHNQDITRNISGNMIHTDDTVGVIHDYQTASPVLIVKDKSCFGSEEDGVGTIYIPIKFCPECGRKLGR